MSSPEEGSVASRHDFEVVDRDLSDYPKDTKLPSSPSQCTNYGIILQHDSTHQQPKVPRSTHVIQSMIFFVEREGVIPPTHNGSPGSRGKNNPIPYCRWRVWCVQGFLPQVFTHTGPSPLRPSHAKLLRELARLHGSDPRFKTLISEIKSSTSDPFHGGCGAHHDPFILI